MHSNLLDFAHSRDSYELREFSETIRKFADVELRSSEFSRDEFNKAAALGLSGMATSEQFGGSLQSCLSTALAVFELSRVRLGPAIYISVHLMVSKLLERWSDNTDSASYLRMLASGEKLGAFCLTEAGAGSDASALSTKAEQVAGEWVLNGEKIYITSGGVADLYLVFARTAPEQKQGISAFLVEKDTPGLSFGPPEKKMGCRGAPITTVTFDDCHIPSERLIGKTGDGYRIALSGLNAGRVSIAAAACGLASKALELATAHAKERRQFGQAIGEFQGLQFMLADMLMRLQASILLTREAAISVDSGDAANTPASIAKCFATDSAMEITTNAVQIFGGAGYLEDYQVERLMRDAKMLQIVEGTNQIQRMLIARGLLE